MEWVEKFLWKTEVKSRWYKSDIYGSPISVYTSANNKAVYFSLEEAKKQVYIIKKGPVYHYID